MSGLWDYEEPVYVPCPVDWGPKSPVEPIAVEDGTSNRPSKKARRSVKPSVSATAVITLDDDSEEENRPSKKAAAGKAAGAKTSRLEEEDLSFFEEPAPCEVPPAAMPMSESLRRALESKQALTTKLLQCDDPDIDESLPPPSARRRIAPLPSFRQPSSPSPEAGEDDELLLLSDAKPADTGAAGPSLSIICQCKQGKASFTLRRADPFSKLQTAFLEVAASKGWLTASGTSGGMAVPPGFKMMFDGEKLAQEATPDTLDMEDGERIDVSWKA